MTVSFNHKALDNETWTDVALRLGYGEADDKHRISGESALNDFIEHNPQLNLTTSAVPEPGKVSANVIVAGRSYELNLPPIRQDASHPSSPLDPNRAIANFEARSRIGATGWRSYQMPKDSTTPVTLKSLSEEVGRTSPGKPEDPKLVEREIRTHNPELRTIKSDASLVDKRMQLPQREHLHAGTIRYDVSRDGVRMDMVIEKSIEVARGDAGLSAADEPTLRAEMSYPGHLTLETSLDDGGGSPTLKKGSVIEIPLFAQPVPPESKK